MANCDICIFDDTNSWTRDKIILSGKDEPAIELKDLPKLKSLSPERETMSPVEITNNKKLFFELALALSLLRVNPDNYLGWGWQSQLALNNGDGWQLELLQPTPVIDYPYSNRKALIPLIEDLVRFDRYRESTANSNHDIQTYLLNIQNEHKTSEANQQASGNDTIIQTIQENRTFSTDHILPPMSNASELDIFLNSDHFVESQTILEQNLADLNDYADLLPYAGLPQKDEPPDLGTFSMDHFHESSRNMFNDFAAADVGGNGGESSDDSSATVIKWYDYLNIKPEVKEENNAKSEDKKVTSEDEKNSTSGVGTTVLSEYLDVKLEMPNDEKNSTSGVGTNVELTEEESEIVEILWKQDVDLGYSLEPIKLPDKDPKLSSASATNDTDDDHEKLKILEEIKNEKDQSEKELEDEWAGIQFTIDSETGEYIQLPLQLDDLLQDVLHVDSLTSDDSLSLPEKEEVEQSTTASVSATTVSDQSESDVASISSVSIDDSTNIKTVEQELAELDISADLSQIVLDVDDASELDEFEMMIQSAGPFQHPRPSQSYSHGSNSYRQSYHQSRVPLSRAVSMEQRLQDIAHLFNPIPGMGVGMGVGDVAPYPHYPSHYSYQSPGPIAQHGQFTHPHSHAVLHNATLAELGGPQPHYGPNLGTAVSSSMHITNTSHEADAGATGYKMDPDMMYYSNASSELNHTTDGFINSILNDEDLQLMDMGVNENFYTMRMLEPNATSNNSSVLGASGGGNHSNGALLPSSMQSTSLSTLGPIGSTGDRLDASSDSAVSSMGSERVPSLSDGEWGDAGSDSAQDFHQRNSSKYGGPYDYSYNNRLGDSARHPVAQKKHHMFGKRFFQEQSNLPSLPHSTSQPHATDLPVKYEYEPYGMHHGSSLPHNLDHGSSGNPLMNKHLSQQPEMKYSCSLDFQRQSRGLHEIVSHNHTYTMPQTPAGASPRPQPRDKKQRRTEDEHLSRDEKRARGLSIPMPVNDIINLPMDEFNERLSKYDLSETQLSLIRDIRRRGKNKVAAQNCRKRKLDQIICLADEVNEVKKRKDRLCHEREVAIAAKKNIMYKFSMLHKHVFQNLRDPDGNPYSQNQYSLQQSADGSIFLLPKDNKDNVAGNNGTTASSAHQPDSVDSLTHSHQPQHHHHHHSHHHQSQQQQQQQQHQHHPHSHHPHHQKD